MEQVSKWKSIKLWAVLLASLFLLIGLFSVVDLVNPEIHFSDPALEQVIRGKIEQPSGPIKRADVQVITEIHAPGRGIHSLEGLGYLSRLAFLDLADNEVKDLTPLTRLQKLVELNLRNNQVADLTPLANMHRLRNLDLRGNRVSDLNPLSFVTDLVYLNLRENLVTDLTPLSGLFQLTYLNLHSNQVEFGFEAMSGMVNLETLILSNIQLGTSYQFFEHLDKLERLNLQNTGLEDITFLIYHPQLISLNLANNRVADLSPMGSLENLVELYLQNNQVGDLTPLARMYYLHTLDLRGNRVSDLSPLFFVTDLVYLNLRENHVTDLAPLSGLFQLTYLNLHSNRVESGFEVVAGMVNLETLILGNIQLGSSYQFLEDLDKLEHLNLRNTGLEEISFLINNPQLVTLNLAKNRVADLSPLDSLENLVDLDLGHNAVSDITPLSGMNYLERINLGHNPLGDIQSAGLPTLSHLPLRHLGLAAIRDANGYLLDDVTFLNQFRSLESLDLSDNDIRDLSPLAELIYLSSLDLSVNTYTDLAEINFELIIGLPLTNLDLSRDSAQGRGGLSDITLLGSFPSLEMVGLRNHRIKDIHPLAYLVNLQKLDLRGNRVNDLTPLAGLNTFKHLNLRGNRISDLTPLKDLTGLTYLNLHSNPVSTGADVLFNLSALETLNLRNVRVDENHHFLAAMHHLKVLNLRNTGFSDLDALSHLFMLTQLNLAENRLSNIQPLGDLTQLNSVNLRHNQVDDLSPMKTLTQLLELDVRGNHIHDLNPLSVHHHLIYLNFRDNDVVDISALFYFPELVYLNIHSNPIQSGHQSLSNLKNLHTLIMRNVLIGDQIAHLEGLANLRRLNLRNASIRDLTVLGSLMECGALQDNHIEGVRAVINIRDNPLPMPLPDHDPFAPIREYWHQISDNKPANIPAIHVEPPSFSVTGGFYDEPLNLTLSTNGDLSIYYTLDGSDPDPVTNPDTTFFYEEPISITYRDQDPNSISMIFPGYGKQPEYGPSEPVFKATIVRANSLDHNNHQSRTITHTYFVDPNMATRYQLPIISILTDPDNLFDDEIGIYVSGKTYDDTVAFWKDINPDAKSHYQPGNFHQRGSHSINIGGISVARYDTDRVSIMLPSHGLRLNFTYLRDVPQITIHGTQFYDGVYYLDRASTSNQLVFFATYIPEIFPSQAMLSRDWERPVVFQFFNEVGQVEFSTDLGMRIHGGASRVSTQKSIRLYVREEFHQAANLNFQLFEDDDQSIFNRFLLRRTRDRSGLNDVLGQLFMQKLNPQMDIQRYRPVVVFINGEFWGWYSIRDRYDVWYLALKHGIDPADIRMIGGQQNEFGKLVNYIREHDLSKSSHYDYVTSNMDIENYLAYMTTGIFLNYTDWGVSKHLLVWRYTGAPEMDSVLDGRWRWLPIDLDGTFTRRLDPESNYLKPVIEERYLLDQLLENPLFKNQFINYFADAMNSVFREDSALIFVSEIIDELPEQLILESEMRWSNNQTTDRWHNHVNEIFDFLERRPTYMREHIIEYFNLSGQANLIINTDLSQGEIQVNTLRINQSAVGEGNPGFWSGVYFLDVPISIQAHPLPGYRFSHWLETGTEDIELNLVLDQDITLTAVFEAIENNQ